MGKGQGIGCTSRLPQGAFVFEFFGEIVSNFEMEKRIATYHKTFGNSFQDYNLSFDIETPSSNINLLCLDASQHGNVARFFNHRCFNANLKHFNVHIERHSTQLYHASMFEHHCLKMFFC